LISDQQSIYSLQLHSLYSQVYTLHIVQ